MPSLYCQQSFKREAFTLQLILLMNRCSFQCLKHSFSWEATVSLGTLESVFPRCRIIPRGGPVWFGFGNSIQEVIDLKDKKTLRFPAKYSVGTLHDLGALSVESMKQPLTVFEARGVITVDEGHLLRLEVNSSG